MSNELLTGEPELLTQNLRINNLHIDNDNVAATTSSGAHHRPPLIQEINDDNDDPPPPIIDDDTTTQSPQLSLMEQMLLEEASSSKQSDEEVVMPSTMKRTSGKKKSSNSGFKKGFLLSSSSTKKAANNKDSSIENVTIQQKKNDPLYLPEVQQTLSSSSTTPDLMGNIESNPKLKQALMGNPAFTQALEKIQRDPSQAKVIFQENPDIASLLQEFCGLLGMHFTKLGGQHSENEVDDDQRHVNQLLANPKVREALMDPDMKRIMQECSHPGRMQAYMSHPVYGPKLQTLMKAGLLQVAR